MTLRPAEKGGWDIMRPRQAYDNPSSDRPGMVMPEKLMPAVIDNLDAFLGFIETGARDLGVEKQALYKILICVDEIITNIISYAYPESQGNLKVDYHPSEDKNQLVIKIVDWGEPFNPLLKDAQDLDRDIDERKIGGLGIHMVRELVDEMAYQRQDEQNVFTMVIRIQ